MTDAVQLPQGSSNAPAGRERGALTSSEIWWRDHQPWLRERGYLLRPRYTLDWVPSWKITGKRWWRCEDAYGPTRAVIMDAARALDGEMVVLKQVRKSRHPYEVDIAVYFSSEPLRSDARNHCIPVYEVLDVPDDPDLHLLVMPFLRPFDDPRMETIGEAVEFFKQIFEGLQFMHEHHVAHRDCMVLNIMMDPKPLYPDMYHPQVTDMKRDFSGDAKRFTRTKRPTRYMLIDFGLSRRYGIEEISPLEDPIWGGDKTVPEFLRSNDPCNPFPTDIYYLGNMIRETFLEATRGLEFMEPLVTDMVQDDPSRRPPIQQVADRFAKLLSSLKGRQLRSRLIYVKEDPALRFFRDVRHFFLTSYYLLARYPALPTPKS
ncbi:hypothetical protein CERSUDRAFT_112564 [Gelatoporia subvermispora B]|uniref:Protein kinase domain-containing protein n=1 Tax=Ceriporiopsis subvermispora (strain B) TaxID=914234 RepID=M2RK41_CERS8|nr:hypothetical protein CERSUDRAFT_112564 [Gelatoporia subvermispora B]